MAIQVGGTTVIDNSRNLTNVGGLKTVGGTSILGSGDISVGASTTFGAVGTYTGAMLLAGVTKAGGDTVSGSSLYKYTGEASNQFERFASSTQMFGAGLSGTWRCMAPFQTYPSGNYGGGTLWVRIS